MLPQGSARHGIVLSKRKPISACFRAATIRSLDYSLFLMSNFSVEISQNTHIDFGPLLRSHITI